VIAPPSLPNYFFLLSGLRGTQFGRLFFSFPFFFPLCVGCLSWMRNKSVHIPPDHFLPCSEVNCSLRGRFRAGPSLPQSSFPPFPFLQKKAHALCGRRNRSKALFPPLLFQEFPPSVKGESRETNSMPFPLFSFFFPPSVPHRERSRTLPFVLSLELLRFLVPL